MKLHAPTTKTIRVTRQQTLRVTEICDFDICQDYGDTRSPETLAINLVKAMEAAGQDIDWVTTSETLEPYPSTSFSAEEAPPEATDAPEIEPAPIPVPEFVAPPLHDDEF